jgi:hypothetical protein
LHELKVIFVDGEYEKLYRFSNSIRPQIENGVVVFEDFDPLEGTSKTVAFNLEHVLGWEIASLEAASTA